MKLRSRARRARRGYTMVELMMAIALLSVSVLGIISLQKVTVVTNTHAKNLAMAQRIAQAVAGQFQLESTQWVTDLPSGGYLNANNAWERPLYNTNRGFGGAFDALGNPLPEDSLANARFCAHVRQSWLYPTTMSVGGNAMLRAEIRVFWLRDGAQPADKDTMCKAHTNDQASTIGLATDQYHFVYQTVGVRQHPRI
jgi:prepilin-type N-terminal cleavage/methylation domain-containing protein